MFSIILLINTHVPQMFAHLLTASLRNKPSLKLPIGHLPGTVGHSVPPASRPCRCRIHLQDYISPRWHSGRWRCILDPRFLQSSVKSSLAPASLHIHRERSDTFHLLHEFSIRQSFLVLVFVSVVFWHLSHPLCRNKSRQQASSRQSLCRCTPKSSSSHRCHFCMDFHSEPPAQFRN